MSTVASKVRACVRQDPYLREGLARDVISHAKLARWMIETKGIDGNEHAMISALRRIDAVSNDPLQEANEAASQLELDVTNGMVAITVDRGARSGRRIPKLHDALGVEVPILPLADSVTIVVPQEDKDRAVEVVGRDILDSVREDLAMFILKDQGEGAHETAAVLGLISERLGSHEVNIEEILTAKERMCILVREADEREARDAILALIEGAT